MEPTVSHTVNYTTDWLASDPVFYNEKTGKVNKNINEVIDFRNLEFHPEGLNNYLDIGYSILEQTPVKHVKFLRHSSKLMVNGNKISVQYNDDPAEKIVGKETKPADVIELLRHSIQSWENSIQGEIVIPTSGGYDSRILNEMISDKQRVRSFTYGLSSDQSKSFEVVYAAKIAEILGVKWEQIELGEFHHYFDKWDELFGPSTHAHGMYQMEFYSKIPVKTNLLSGIIGDAWAGSVKIPELQQPADVFALGYSHKMNADSSQSLFKSNKELLGQYFSENKHKLGDARMRVVESMRFKIVLLCYLSRVPQNLGFNPWSPFLDQDIALAMLNLPAADRAGRAWQVEYFKKKGLHVESMNLTASKKNKLNRLGMYKVPVKPLDVKLLSEIIKPGYVEWVNKHVQSMSYLRDFVDSLQYYPKIGGALRLLGMKDVKLTAYLAYLTLRPLEKLIKKRNNS
jgi:hypothetical protein